jgi:hypothetical protein
MGGGNSDRMNDLRLYRYVECTIDNDKADWYEVRSTRLTRYAESDAASLRSSERPACNSIFPHCGTLFLMLEFSS